MISFSVEMRISSLKSISIQRKKCIINVYLVKKQSNADMKIKPIMQRDSATTVTTNMVEQKSPGTALTKSSMLEECAKTATSTHTTRRKDNKM
jgi:hypothetical protein